MSKFGAHVSLGPRSDFGPALRRCAEAGSPVPGLLALDQDVWPDVAQYSPLTIVAFRTQVGGNPNPPGIWQGDPNAVADEWYDFRRPMWLKNKAHYYVPCNEMDAATLEQFDWQNAFDLRMMQRADADGISLGIGVHSTGTPSDFPVSVDEVLFKTKRESWLKYRSMWRQARQVYADKLAAQSIKPFDLPRYQKWARLVPSLQYAKAHGHVLIVHEYGFDTTLPFATPDHALRYQSALSFLAQFDADPQVIVGECSDFNGYSGEGTTWLQGVEWYDRQVMDDRHVKFFCGYQLGGAENWQQLIGRWADYVSVTPTPEEPVAYKFDHSHLDGGAEDTSNPRTFVMSAAHTLQADFSPVTAARFMLTVNVTPAGAGTVVLTPAQPADGYPAGTMVTAEFVPA